jgi:hypothetical protein
MSLPAHVGRRDDRDVKLEVGPISHVSAVAWLDYATEALTDLRRLPDAQLPAKALDTFGDLVAAWRAIVDHDAGAFRWRDDVPPERAEFLMRALYEAGLVIERASAAGESRLRPHEADEFHRVLIDCVLSTLEGEAPSSAQFAEAMRAEWRIAHRP